MALPDGEDFDQEGATDTFALIAWAEPLGSWTPEMPATLVVFVLDGADEMASDRIGLSVIANVNPPGSNFRYPPMPSDGARFSMSAALPHSFAPGLPNSVRLVLTLALG